jgi:hypothetical protein
MRFSLQKKKSQRYLESLNKNHISEKPLLVKASKSETIEQELILKRAEVAQYEKYRIIEKPKLTAIKEKQPNYRRLIITIAVLALFVLTNPDLEVHQEKVKTKLFEDTKENIADNLGNTLYLNKKQTEIWSRLITPLSLNIYIPQIIKRQNFILFSFTVAKWEENEQIIGIGILGNVVLFSELISNTSN